VTEGTGEGRRREEGKVFGGKDGVGEVWDGRGGEEESGEDGIGEGRKKGEDRMWQIGSVDARNDFILYF
jgi:hypothetical protein